jgi:hypothetical protein
MPWGDDLAGRNEQALAAAITATAAPLAETATVLFPWSRYQRALMNAERDLARQLEGQLAGLLERAAAAGARQVITTYAGPDLAWAGETVGGYSAITAVFSCLLTDGFQPPADQRWHPIALPRPAAAAGKQGTVEATTSLPYQHLQQIWQAVQAGEPPAVPRGSLLLPGNQELWRQLFAGVGTDKRKAHEEAARAAVLLAEEHGEQHGVIQILRMMGSNAAEAFSLDANNFKLRAGAHPQAIGQGRADQIAYVLHLKKSHRTPLAYRQIAERCPRLRCVDLPSSIAITGSPGDHNRGHNSLCISEEPWWDLCSCGGHYGAGETGYLDGIFDDLPIPYYLAVNPLILERISVRLAHLAAMPTDAILQRLNQAPIRYLGIHEFRLGQDKTGTVHPSLRQHRELRALSALRTKIGIHARARGLGATHGKGWGKRGFQGLRRNAFADWHLDKLQLIRSCAPRLGMAIENVHQRSYVTEKPFDMLCSGVVPITYAGPGHTLHRYLDADAHLNLHGSSLGTALEAIAHFQPSAAVAEAIQTSASRLAALFGCSAARETTLERVAERCERWVLQQCRNRTYRSNTDGDLESLGSPDDPPQD